MDDGRHYFADWPDREWRWKLRPPISPWILRHPPTFEEWLDSLLWVRLPPMRLPIDRTAPDEGRSRIRLVGYEDEVTTRYGSPIRLRTPLLKLAPADDGVRDGPLRPEEWPRHWRPPITPVLLRHPPTYEEWLDSLPWLRRVPVVPCEDYRAPPREIRIVGYRDSVTVEFGTPLRVRHPLWEFVAPKE